MEIFFPRFKLTNIILKGLFRPINTLFTFYNAITKVNQDDNAIKWQYIYWHIFIDIFSTRRNVY